MSLSLFPPSRLTLAVLPQAVAFSLQSVSPVSVGSGITSFKPSRPPQFINPRWTQSGNEGPLPPFDWGCSSTTQPAGQSAQGGEDSRPEHVPEDQDPLINDDSQDGSATSNALPCPECLTLLATRKKYTAHLNTHTRPFKCNVAGCNASFALRKDRDRHTKEQHGSTRWYCNFPGSGIKYEILRLTASVDSRYAIYNETTVV
ncbi:hypothetical protein Forpi1262_v018485 [Fusarium oxysporum f. sp. raphani]|uniref:C2H2-type domain-containing protein n=1 Tax=Fusarium oxysporum f. sp. raphani TaxID=96318 RepID=A0A8J5TN77_FUSOX|nr:hypothetical protein Forpi1262_v018485 [Fusarium oxysporum f. sp. raphani]